MKGSSTRCDSRIRHYCRAVQSNVCFQICLYMSSYKAQWLALTSHNKWIFFRSHLDREQPYITYSDFEEQRDNTRPFRAFLAIILVTAMDRTVESHANTAAPLPSIEDDKGDEEDDSCKQEHESGGGSEGAGENCLVTQDVPKGTRAPPDLLVSRTLVSMIASH